MQQMTTIPGSIQTINLITTPMNIPNQQQPQPVQMNEMKDQTQQNQSSLTQFVQQYPQFVKYQQIQNAQVQIDPKQQQNVQMMKMVQQNMNQLQNIQSNQSNQPIQNVQNTIQNTVQNTQQNPLQNNQQMIFNPELRLSQSSLSHQSTTQQQQNQLKHQPIPPKQKLKQPSKQSKKNGSTARSTKGDDTQSTLENTTTTSKPRKKKQTQKSTNTQDESLPDQIQQIQMQQKQLQQQHHLTFLEDYMKLKKCETKCETHSILIKDHPQYPELFEKLLHDIAKYCEINPFFTYDCIENQIILIPALYRMIPNERLKLIFKITEENQSWENIPKPYYSTGELFMNDQFDKSMKKTPTLDHFFDLYFEYVNACIQQKQFNVQI